MSQGSAVSIWLFTRTRVYYDNGKAFGNDIFPDAMWGTPGVFPAFGNLNPPRNGGKWDKRRTRSVSNGIIFINVIYVYFALLGYYIECYAS